MFEKVKNWWNEKTEITQTKTKIGYYNRARLAKWSMIFGILSIVFLFVISSLAPRSDIPSLIEAQRETYKLLEPYQTLVYVCVLLFVFLIAIALLFGWKSEKFIPIPEKKA